MAAPGADVSCALAQPLGGLVGTWSEVKRIVVDVATSTQDGIRELSRHKGQLLDVVFDPEAEARCPIGHYTLRLAFYLLLDAADRVERLCEELGPFALGDVSVVEVLSSGWPVYGILGLLAYRLVRDGVARGEGRGADAPDCGTEVESFRVRYLPACFHNEDVRFSRDVEAHVGESLLGRDMLGGNVTQRCLLGAALPLLGHAASIQCLARRDASLQGYAREIISFAEHEFLRPAARWRAPLSVNAALVQSCRVRHGSLLALLGTGFWAAESLLLLQRAAPAFAQHGPRPPLGGLEPPADTSVIVSFDPHEDRFYGKGLPALVNHLWGSSQHGELDESGRKVQEFRVRHALPCADVLVVRDSLPALPFPGALVYVDHEAGLGQARDAGRLDGELAKHRVVYLGVLEPLAQTRCISRAPATSAARARRHCARVSSGRGSWPSAQPAHAVRGVSQALSGPPALSIVHVPFASTSFAGRLAHTPADLATRPRPFSSKPGFVGYLAYACVDHREFLFDQLVAVALQQGLGDADALSKCAGFRSGHRRVRRNNTRNNEATFLDEAVELLRPYRFALVFENKLVPGYVTEKIVNAFLAGSIPIYWGSSVVRDVFNPEAFIYANELQGSSRDDSGADPLQGLERVAAEVARLATDHEAFRRMATAPVLSPAQLRRYFSWHRGVRGIRPQPGDGPEHRGNEESGTEEPDLQERLTTAVASVMHPRQRVTLCTASTAGGSRLCATTY